MALDGTYAGLQASVADWLKRGDLTISIPDFIALAESRLARRLRLRQQWKADSLVFATNVQAMPLPADWLEFEVVQVRDGDVLEFTTPRDLAERVRGHYTTAPGGVYPSVYSIEGTSLVLPPQSGGVTLDIAYRARIATVIGTTDVQPLLAASPGVYLWASLAEAAPFMVNDARVQLWESKYEAEVSALEASDRAAEHSGSALRMRTR